MDENVLWKIRLALKTPTEFPVVVAKEPRRCKLTVNDEIVEQVISFRYLGAEITAHQDRRSEVKKKIDKASRIAGCLKDIIWKNLKIEAKTRIYKSCVRPIITYAAETMADTSRTKSITRTAEIRTLRSITGHTLRDRKPNQEIRRICDIQDIVRLTRQRRRERNQHINRMEPQ